MATDPSAIQQDDQTTTALAHSPWQLHMDEEEHVNELRNNALASQTTRQGHCKTVQKPMLEAFQQEASLLIASAQQQENDVFAVKLGLARRALVKETFLPLLDDDDANVSFLLWILRQTCGSWAMLSVANEILQEISRKDNKIYDYLPEVALESCLACIRLLLLPSSSRHESSYNNDHQHPDRNISISDSGGEGDRDDPRERRPWWKDDADLPVVGNSETLQVQQHQASCLEPWVNLLVLFPQAIANACHSVQRNLPRWSIASRFYPRLMEGILLRMIRSDDDHEDDGTTGRLLGRLLVERIVRRGNRGADHVALGLYQYGRRHSASNNDFSSVCGNLAVDLTQGLSARETVALCQSMIQLALHEPPSSSGWMRCWDEFCRSLLLAKSNKDVWNTLVRLTILSPHAIQANEKSDRDFCHNIASLLVLPQVELDKLDRSDLLGVSVGDDENCDSSRMEFSDEASALFPLLVKMLEVVSATWSQAIFVQQSDPTFQRHVTNFLVSGLQLLGENARNTKVPAISVPALDASCELVSLILPGVTERLHVTNNVSIRMDGMYVAEQLAARLGQDLKFDELDEVRRKEEKNAVLSFSENTDEESEVRKAGPSRRRKKAKKQRDPDAEYISDDDSGSSHMTLSSDDGADDDDSVWDQNSALVPYNLSDDENDLREVASPLYLGDCLDLLRTPETEENAASRHEAALQGLSALVKSRPVDLPDLGPSLAVQLMRMEDKFGLQNYKDMVMNSLCAITVQEPVSVGQTLIGEMFGECSLSNRLDILSTLNDAAFELCGNKALAEASTVKNALLDGPRVQGKRALVKTDENYGETISKTRRWGRGRRFYEPSIFLNQFTSVAPVWFYSMIGHFLKCRDESAIWGGHVGAAFLSRFFLTLAVIVETCGQDPSTDVLARDLFELAWNFRDAEIAQVRASVLTAISTSLSSTRVEHTIRLFDGFPEFVRFLRETAANDTDQQCRVIANDLVSCNIVGLLANL